MPFAWNRRESHCSCAFWHIPQRLGHSRRNLRCLQRGSVELMPSENTIVLATVSSLFEGSTVLNVGAIHAPKSYNMDHSQEEEVYNFCQVSLQTMILYHKTAVRVRNEEESLLLVNTSPNITERGSSIMAKWIMDILPGVPIYTHMWNTSGKPFHYQEIW